MVQQIQDDLYHQARASIAVFIDERSMYLRLTGETRVDYLQRQTTNDITKLSDGAVMHTVLTNPSARILDVLTLLPEANRDSIGVIPLPDRGAETLAHFNSRIFFNDKVKFEDVSDTLTQLTVIGHSFTLLTSLDLTLPKKLDDVITSQVADATVTLYQTAPQQIHIIVDASSRSDVLAALNTTGVIEVPEPIYNVLRVECGLAGPSEMTESYTPLEIGLRDYISDDKGCYTGQEVIARQITYDKVTKQLVGLTSGRMLEPGTELRADGRRVGYVTSSVESPMFGPIALAVVKNAAASTDTHMESEQGVIATVTHLPFSL